jgi:hypothetical protein
MTGRRKAFYFEKKEAKNFFSCASAALCRFGPTHCADE